jgi:pimeloyl-ACP methyl ester carboxylesterase
MERCMGSRTIRSLGLFLLAVAFATAEAAAASEAPESGPGNKRDDSRRRISGLIPVDGRRIYLECIGSGSPTVVLISGGFEAGWIWKYALYSTDLVQDLPTDEFAAGRGDARKLDRAAFPTTGGYVRVCNYDRPNTTLGDAVEEERNGRVSTPVEQPHSATQDVADLHKLLTAARVPGPYVLVAHSYGGLIAELYARTYPAMVAGRVLVDVTNVFLKDTLAPGELANLDAGVMALNPDAPDAERLMILDAMNSILSAPAPPRVPVFVLTADKPPNLAPATVNFIQKIVRSQDMLAASLCAKHLKRTTSGHHVFAEQPQLVNDAIREVVEAARKGCPSIPCEGVPPKTDASIVLSACADGR